MRKCRGLFSLRGFLFLPGSAAASDYAVAKKQVNTEPVELDIHDIAFGGAGVGRIDGKACFVKFVVPGEKVRARVVREGFGDVQAATAVIMVM